VSAGWHSPPVFFHIRKLLFTKKIIIYRVSAGRQLPSSAKYSWFGKLVVGVLILLGSVLLCVSSRPHDFVFYCIRRLADMQ